MAYRCELDTPLGKATLKSDDGEALSGFWFEEQAYFPSDALEWKESKALDIFQQVEKWAKRYFNQENPDITFSLKPVGTAFQQTVWKQLNRIPYGQTVTYGQIAKILNAEGAKTSPRAVGNAVGKNPISVLIPCHRVIGASGSLTGYAGGFERKTALLKLEGVLIEQNKIRSIH